jgi:aryl-alcohol dehydrogenase-like predicted oxidoreductase
MADKLTRRKFMRDSAIAGAAIGAGIGLSDSAGAADTSKILNYSPDMEYRQCGRTGMMISAVSLGGHWKRLVKIIGGSEPEGWMTTAIDDPKFQKNRHEVVTRCIDRGINYVDACCREEILAYAKALKGRRDKMFFGYSWHILESRFEEWRSAKKLQQGFDEGMQEAGAEVEEAVRALEWAKKTGRARFIGFSSHHRPHLKKIIETYSDQIDVILTPYTANSKLVTDESGLWATLKKYDVGWFGIKPFASNSLFKGDSSPDSPHFAQDNKIARLALRHILCNPAITAPIAGLISIQQVDNAALAVKERRELDVKERAELDEAASRAWASLPANYQWLRDWEYV